MIKRILLVILVIFCLSCGPNLDGFDSQIIDAKSKSTIVLKARPDQKDIHLIQILFKGYLHESARIAIDDISKTAEISGDVSLNFSNEWYTTECSFEYTPLHLKSGALIVYYKFGEI